MVVHPADETLRFEVEQMFMHGGQGRETKVLADFCEGRCIAVLFDIMLEVVHHLLLPLGKRRHMRLFSPIEIGSILAKVERRRNNLSWLADALAWLLMANGAKISRRSPFRELLVPHS